MTQMTRAKENRITDEMKIIAKMEEVNLDFLVDKVASGKVILIPGRAGTPPVAIGEGVRSKVLVNLGTSSQSPDIELEIQKAKIAVERGASIICDQSVGPNVFENRKKLIEATNAPIATVPLYQTVETTLKEKGNPLDFVAEDLITGFKQQVLHGVTAPGIHPMTKDLNEFIKKSKRIMPTVSRGGTILANWVEKTRSENPYIEFFDEILGICQDNDVPLTLVSSCRSGCLADGFDDVQIYEWKLLRSLIRKAHTHGISVAVDGLGHMSMDQIPLAVRTFKKMCFGIPLGVMGPATTDRALGYEHVAHAIGASLAILHGANYCQACCRTEHLGLPELTDIPEAVGAFLVATYAADLGKNGAKFKDLDYKMAKARKDNLWGVQLSLALEKIGAKETFDRVGPKNKDGEGCSICGELYPLR